VRYHVFYKLWFVIATLVKQWNHVSSIEKVRVKLLSQHDLCSS